MDWSILVIVIQLIFLEGILSIDNAAVLGALAAPLATNLRVPWPHSLRALGKALDPLLGSQRTAVLRVGLLGAYLGRGFMLTVASLIIQNPWLRLIGGIYLIRLAFDDLGSSTEGEEESGDSQQLKRKTFWATVLTVELMDLAFSLDNVVAAVSLSDKLWVVILGVAIGIIVMRFAAGIFSFMVEREPILQRAAYVLVFNIGVELLLEDFAGIEINDWVKFGISLSTLVLALAYEHIPFLKIFRPVLIWISQGFGLLNGLINWLLAPLGAIVRLLWHLVRRMFRRVFSRPVNAES
jgi:tellurite resistance protein TerC